MRHRDNPEPADRRKLRLGIALAVFDAAVAGVADYLNCDPERARRVLLAALTAIDEEQ